MGRTTESIMRLQAIFEAAIDGIIIINESGIIEEVNSATCNLFKYTRDELIGSKIQLLMRWHDARYHDQYLDSYKKTRNAKIIGTGREVKGVRKDGIEFPFWLSVVEIGIEKKTFFTGFIHDLSELKTAENKLKYLNEILERKVVERTYELENAVNQLLALNRKLETEISEKISAQNELHLREMELEKSLAKERELGELKSRFVSMASHEFRTPLSTILSSVSLINRYVDADGQANREKHINKIKSSVTHLTGILNDFLSLNKLEEGKISSHIEKVEIRKLFGEIIEEMNTILKAGQKIKSHFNIHDGEVFTDPKILKNILINLLSNAIKYSGEGDPIDFTLKTNEAVLEFSIRDYGIGIPEEDQKHLFDRFFRASNVINIEGTGLGLNIVRKYVEMLGGDITYNSTLNEGSEFNIVLPNCPETKEEIKF